MALFFCAGWLVMLAANAPQQITADQRARFWRAQAEYMGVSVQLQKARATLDAVQAELTRTCGERRLVAGQDGEPSCAPKPESPKATAKESK